MHLCIYIYLSILLHIVLVLTDNCHYSKCKLHNSKLIKKIVHSKADHFFIILEKGEFATQYAIKTVSIKFSYRKYIILKYVHQLRLHLNLLLTFNFATINVRL